jgi:hypothetical protein
MHCSVTGVLAAVRTVRINGVFPMVLSDGYGIARAKTEHTFPVGTAAEPTAAIGLVDHTFPIGMLPLPGVVVGFVDHTFPLGLSQGPTAALGLVDHTFPLNLSHP